MIEVCRQLSRQPTATWWLGAIYSTCAFVLSAVSNMKTMENFSTPKQPSILAFTVALISYNRSRKCQKICTSLLGFMKQFFSQITTKTTPYIYIKNLEPNTHTMITNFNPKKMDMGRKHGKKGIEYGKRNYYNLTSASLARLSFFTRYFWINETGTVPFLWWDQKGGITLHELSEWRTSYQNEERVNRIRKKKKIKKSYFI